jgi:hypothetical protein
LVSKTSQRKFASCFHEAVMSFRQDWKEVGLLACRMTGQPLVLDCRRVESFPLHQLLKGLAIAVFISHDKAAEISTTIGQVVEFLVRFACKCGDVRIAGLIHEAIICSRYGRGWRSRITPRNNRLVPICISRPRACRHDRSANLNPGVLHVCMSSNDLGPLRVCQGNRELDLIQTSEDLLHHNSSSGVRTFSSVKEEADAICRRSMIVRPKQGRRPVYLELMPDHE